MFSLTKSPSVASFDNQRSKAEKPNAERLFFCAWYRIAFGSREGDVKDVERYGQRLATIVIGADSAGLSDCCVLLHTPTVFPIPLQRCASLPTSCHHMRKLYVEAVLRSRPHWHLFHDLFICRVVRHQNHRCRQRRLQPPTVPQVDMDLD
ncbi:hypothetical protein TELCIR_12986 [Teladorsagia circumcincta]|uniref:Uncharacterized protein n=1 Tax=Teladorsagia circumcincta TaxID=45464 RepID=A0A2G9U4Z8_TELCI|nr:hypothetical protein TELCIR_12986 [Teladorsagia circumcincta]